MCGYRVLTQAQSVIVCLGALCAALGCAPCGKGHLEGSIASGGWVVKRSEVGQYSGVLTLSTGDRVLLGSVQAAGDGRLRLGAVDGARRAVLDLRVRPQGDVEGEWAIARAGLVATGGVTGRFCRDSTITGGTSGVAEPSGTGLQ
jgi:hypothetical protein